MTSPLPRPKVQDRHIDDAASFLDALSPRDAWWSGRPDNWVYRGQANAEWRLDPTAIRRWRDFERYGVRRDEKRADFDPDVAPGWSERQDLQDALLRRFRVALDREGLPIPQVSTVALDDDDHMVHDGGAPPPSAFPLMALAQHHSLPTLLLDWSRRAWVAAYFAAQDVAAKQCAGELGGITHLAVWALQRGERRYHPCGLAFHEAPASSNLNLRAQSGLFTTLPADQEQCIALYLASATSAPALRRVTLPAEQAPRLLRFLAHEGITGASMFPGPDGVVRAMRELATWDRPS